MTFQVEIAAGTIASGFGAAAVGCGRCFEGKREKRENSNQNFGSI